MKPNPNEDHTLEGGQIFAHYRIAKPLGTGGMGEVYLAADTKLGRNVALKILPFGATRNPESVLRFEQEARAASALNHPNIAHIYEIGESEGVHFIAMEYVEGVSLGDKINGCPLSIAEAVRLGIQMADALDEAHSRGIVHRDIKSANVMLDNRGRVKVLDFGLAKISREVESEESTRVKTRSGVVMGTASYMSPEQALGRETGPRTDIWSLGVILYEMTTGRLPFHGESITETIDRITHAQPEAIARFNYDVPAELEVIIKKSLRKSPEERYQSAHDLLIDLRALSKEIDLSENSSAPAFRGEHDGKSSFTAETGEQAAQTSIHSHTTEEAVPTSHTTSSAEYVISEIKRHRTGIGIVAAILVIGL
jgi:Serine/threonine protein kinase